MVATILIACGGWACVRTGGFTNDFKHDLHWRWSQTSEERVLAQAMNEPVAPPPAPSATPASTMEDPAMVKVAPKEIEAAPKENPAAMVASPAGGPGCT